MSTFDTPSHIVKVRKSIFVQFQKEGVHRYPEALEREDLFTNDWRDVSFLGHPHRHIFHFKVEMSVTHDNRDVEFIQLKRELERLYDNGTLHLNYKSCEMMADDLYQYLSVNYPHRTITITVSEDGENGAVATYEVIG